jgi:hypothetical protein
MVSRTNADTATQALLMPSHWCLRHHWQQIRAFWDRTDSNQHCPTKCWRIKYGWRRRWTNKSLFIYQTVLIPIKNCCRHRWLSSFFEYLNEYEKIIEILLALKTSSQVEQIFEKRGKNLTLRPFTYCESTNEKERKGGRDYCNFSQGRSRVIKGGMVLVKLVNETLNFIWDKPDRSYRLLNFMQGPWDRPRARGSTWTHKNLHIGTNGDESELF